MGYFFAIIGTIAGFCATFTTVAALATGTDVQLILGGIYWISAVLCWVGAGIIFRMDEQHSKKDTLK